MSLAVLRARVERLVGASSVGVDLGTDEHLEAALLVYGGRRPRTVVFDLVSPADGAAELALPEPWDPQFSARRVARVEYPVGKRPPTVLARHEYQVYAGPDGEVISFDGRVFAAGAVVRVTLLVPHLMDEGSTTLPREAWSAVAMLAASTVCLSLATAYGHREDASHGLDSVRHGGGNGGPGAEFARLAKAFRAQAESELPGLEPAKASPAACEASVADHGAHLTH